MWEDWRNVRIGGCLVGGEEKSGEIWVTHGTYGRVSGNGYKDWS
jgi:hypothetical protein